jgi:hypothetical protein
MGTDTRLTEKILYAEFRLYLPRDVGLLFCSIGTRAEKCAASNARNT